LIAMVPAVIMLGAWRPLSTVLAPAFRWRLIGEVSAVIFYFAALFRLPLADVNALIQFAPIATMMAVAILFREPVGWRRWSAAGVGLIGVLAIIGPGTETFSPYALLVLVAVVGIAIRDIATREMDRSLPGLYIAFITALAITLLGVAHLPFEQWSWPVRNDLLALGFSGGFLLGAYMLMVVALRRGEISVVSPFRFTKMIWAIAIGYLVWGEVPGPLASFGFVLVMAAGLFIFFRERALEKSAARA
ncbi:MAG: DMT family transporter, partial [Pseudomonadota bacterium]